MSDASHPVMRPHRRSSLEQANLDFDYIMKMIYEARENIKPYIKWTPLEENRSFSEMSGARIFLKKENLQKTGSFKVRGGLNGIIKLTDEQKEKGVCCVSAGNHAQGIAYASQALGIKATIFMPSSAPVAKVLATRGYGATVELAGNFFDDTFAACNAFIKKTGSTFVHPFNNDAVIAGQGTIGLEIYEQAKDYGGMDAVLVPIGGGGIAAGIAVAIKQLSPDTKVYGVQTANMPSMHASLRAGHVTKPRTVRPTFCDGIAVQQPGELTFEAAKRLLDGVILVEEKHVAKAIFFLLERVKNVVEPAGATALGAVVANKIDLKGQKVGVVLTGGNIDMTMLLRVIRTQQFALRRAIRIRGHVPDKVGHLDKILEVLTRARVLIVDLDIDRFLPELPPTKCEVRLHLEVPEERVLDNILFDIKELGYSCRATSNYEYYIDYNDAI